MGVIVVTGATRGIGAALTDLLIEEGHFVIGIHKNPTDKRWSNVNYLRCDISKMTEIKELCAYITSTHGRIDGLVNNAGRWEPEKLTRISLSLLKDTFDVNTFGPLFFMQNLLFDDSASIVNVASKGGQIGGTEAPHYGMSKAALISLTKSASKVMAPVRVNAVSPGLVDTDMLKPGCKTDDIPLGRVAEPSEVANVIAWLLSEKSSYVTGAVINVNGGMF